MICVGKHKEDILQNGSEEALEESVAGLNVCFCHVVEQLQAHVQTRCFNVAVVVLTCPHARINDELELARVQP